MPVSCTLDKKLGDCRRTLGDPNASGWCNEDDGSCFRARICTEQRCSWQPFCANGSQETNDKFCLPSEWGPVDSECAWGNVHRYRRCRHMDLKDSLTITGNLSKALGSTSLLCSGTPQPKIEQAQLVYTRSRLPNCARCGIGQTACQECVRQDIFDVSKGCSNREPMLELRTQVSITAEAKETFRLLPFDTLSKLVAGALGSTGTWDADHTFLTDAFTVSTQELPVARLGEAEIRTTLIEDDQTELLLGMQSRLPRDKHESWELVIALQLPGKTKVNEMNASAKINQGSNHIVATLEKALRKLLPGPVSVVVGDVSLFCPGMERAPFPWSSCEQKKSGVPLKLILIAAGAGILIIAAIVMVCWRFECLCFKKRPAPTLQLLR